MVYHITYTEERLRLEDCADAEVLLLKQPISVMVKVKTATAHMPDIDWPGIYVLTPKSRIWT